MIANTPTTSDTVEPANSTPQASPLDKYKLLALETLADILRNPESSDLNRRLASVAILKYAAAVETKPPPAPARAATNNNPPGRSTSLEASAAEAFARHHTQHAIYEEALTIAYERGYDDARQSLPANPIDAVGVARESYFRMCEDAADP